MRAAAESSRRSRSAAAARSVARPATMVPVLPKAPVSWPTSAVSDCRTRIAAGPVPSTAAAICACTVAVPLPNSAVPTASS